jgi:hypothetical protein
MPAPHFPEVSMRKWTAFCVGLVWLAATSIGAQQNATLTLTSGEQLQGQLVDLGGVGFTFRVNGQDRQIPRNQVRIVDFGGGSSDVPDAAVNLPSGANLMVLRSGETVQGEFYDVSGTQPLRITFRSGGSERVVSAGDVQRIYMTRVDSSAGGGAGGGRGGSPIQGRTVTVAANSQWTPTGLTVRQGQRVQFSSSGQIRINGQGQMATVAGSVDGLRDSSAPIPGDLQGALIARIGGVGGARGARAGGSAGGTVFGLGDQTSIVMPATGALFLGVNDGNVSDNSGSFSVVVSQQ